MEAKLLIINDYTSARCYIVPIPENVEAYLKKNFDGSDIDYFTTDSVKIDSNVDYSTISYEPINFK